MPSLARSVVAPRNPRRAAVIVGVTVAAVAANVTFLGVMLPHLRTQGVLVIEVPVEPPVVAAASAAPPPPVDVPAAPVIVPALVPPAAPVGADVAIRACPPPRRDAPRLTLPELDEEIAQVMVAPSNAGWVAAWNADHVFVSTDAGAHFDRVLDGPGAVSAVGFDCFGTVVVVRAQQVGLRVGSDERWQPVPGVELMSMDEEPEGHAAVVSGGPEVIVVGRRDPESWAPRLARSRDLGQHWRYHDLEADWETPEIRGRQREDGSIALSVPSTDCAGDGELLVAIRAGRVTTESGPGWWPRVGARIDVEPWPVGLPEGAIWAGDGLARAGERLYRVRGARAVPLPVVVEGEAYVSDPAGRLWTVLCGEPVIAGRSASGLRCGADAE